MSENPVTQLREVLQSFRAESGNSKTVSEAWARVLGTGTDDRPAILTGIASVLKLLSQSVVLVKDRTTPDDVEMYMRPLNRASAVLSHFNLESGTDTMRNKIDTPLIEQLEMTANMVERSGLPDELDADLISEVVASLEAVCSEVEVSDLEEPTKDLILARLKEVINTLSNLRYRTLDEARDAIDKAVGSVVTRGDELKKESKLVSKILETLKWGIIVIEFGERSVKVALPWVKALLQ